MYSESGDADGISTPNITLSHLLAHTHTKYYPCTNPPDLNRTLMGSPFSPLWGHDNIIMVNKTYVIIILLY